MTRRATGWPPPAPTTRARPEHATRYRAAFDAHRATAADEGRLDVSTVVAQAPAPRANTFPLLTEPAGAPRLGSLVPTDG
jgi:hypothetical protein